MPETQNNSENLPQVNNDPEDPGLEQAKKNVKEEHDAPLLTKEELIIKTSLQNFLNNPATTLESLYADPQLLRVFSMYYGRQDIVSDQMISKLQEKIGLFLVNSGYTLGSKPEGSLNKNGYISVPKKNFITNDLTPTENRVIFGQKVLIGLKNGKLVPESVGESYEGKGSENNFPNK